MLEEEIEGEPETGCEEAKKSSVDQWNAPRGDAWKSLQPFDTKRPENSDAGLQALEKYSCFIASTVVLGEIHTPRESHTPWTELSVDGDEETA